MVRAPRDWQEYVAKVHCYEGVAIHVAPDPCAGAGTHDEVRPPSGFPRHASFILGGDARRMP
jgi:hypothetical protein